MSDEQQNVPQYGAAPSAQTPQYGQPAQGPQTPQYGQPAQGPQTPQYGQPAQGPQTPQYGRPAAQAPQYGQSAQAPQYGQQQPYRQPVPPAAPKPAAPSIPAESDYARFMGALSYIPFMFGISLAKSKDSEYIRFHARQGMGLFVLQFVLLTVYKGFDWLFDFIYAVSSYSKGLYIAMHLFSGFFNVVTLAAGVVLALMGLFGALKGKSKPLPLIGGMIK